MMFQLVTLGAMAGGGLLMVIRGLFPPRSSLDEELLALAAPNWSDTPGRTAGSESEAGARAIRALNLDLRKLDVDLRVIGRSHERHVLERLKTATVMAAAPLVLGLLMPAALGGNPLLPPVPMAASPLVLAATGWLLTDHQVRARAAKRRREFDAGLATYLGLVASLTAAGSGLEEAMWVAVEQGRGWSFQVVRRALSDARNRGSTPWELMEEHGRRFDLPSLIELGATFQLSGTSGAHIRETVMTKAASLRNHQLTVIEAEANANTAAMAGPIGFMLAGFVILLLFPAVTTVLSL
jgi:Flp pilus assembly protein TadB